MPTVSSITAAISCLVGVRSKASTGTQFSMQRIVGLIVMPRSTVCWRILLKRRVWTSTWKRSTEGWGVNKCTDFLKSHQDLLGECRSIILYSALTLPWMPSFHKADVFFCGNSGQVNQDTFFLQIHHQAVGQHDSVVNRGCSRRGREPSCQTRQLSNPIIISFPTVSTSMKKSP